MSTRALGLAAAVVALVAAAAVIFRHTLPLRSAGAEARPAACGVHSDFLVRSDPLLAPVQPRDCSTLTQTPPEFTWPPLDGKFTYTVMLTGPDGKTESKSTGRNWLVWDHVLPPGTYTWRMKSTSDSDVTEPRTFTIAPDPVEFLLPSPDEIVRRARATPHPRTWAHGASSPLPAFRGERANGFSAMAQEADDKRHLPVQEEPRSESKDSNYNDTVDEQKRTLASALAWAGTHDPRYGADAARRLLAQAAWSTTGPIGFSQNDMASRNVAWTLALGYDWTYDYLSAEQKKKILEAIRARTRDMYEEYVATNEISRYPYDSHGNLTLTVTAAIAALTAGDLPEADEWLKGAAQMAIVWTSPWGGADGGFGNGTAQADWDTGTNLPVWYVLKNATGIDLSKKEWVRNYSRYLAYFLPPNTPSGLFGDGQEQKLSELWARIGQAYTDFAPSPLGIWYASQLKGADPARLEILLAPRMLDKSDRLPEGTPNAAAFPSIGWAAMHSDLADPERTSVYFRSSPYGSYNHSHADQNSFVVNSRGKRLAIASGYYDNYRTPHWTEWYKQTRAANAITYDGGKGEGSDGRQFTGEITHFETHPAYDIVVGHAEKAYDGKLTKAERTLVFLRPDLILVRDSLASPAPHTWEWNIHALNRMQQLSDRKVAIVNGDAKMCVEMLGGPDVAFSQTDRFTAAPEPSSMNKSEPNQWHGVFATKAPSASAEFVALMRVGSDCKAPDARLTRSGDALTVQAEGKTVTLHGTSVALL